MPHQLEPNFVGDMLHADTLGRGNSATEQVPRWLLKLTIESYPRLRPWVVTTDTISSTKVSTNPFG